MSGLVGVWNLDGRPVTNPVLSAMSRTLTHRGPDGEGTWDQGPAGLRCRHLWVTPEDVGQTQPIVGRSGAVLLLDGRLDNRDELLGVLDLPRAASDAACALAAYETWGERFAERLAGDFAVALFDPRHQHFLLVRDPVGVRCLYYFRNDRLFAFASEIKALLAHPDIPARRDDEGLADYLLVASRPVDRQEVTCFTGILAVVPSHVTLVTPRRITTRRYWDFDIGTVLRLGSYGDYVEAFGAHFATAVRRRTRAAAPIAVSLSGGLDSSSIFCQGETLRRNGSAAASRIAAISYVTADGGGADEKSYLREIECAYDVSVGRIQVEPLIGILSGAEDQVRALEAPFLDHMWGVTRELYRQAGRTGARQLLTGHWGDEMLFSSSYLVDLFRRFAWAEARRHLRAYRGFFGPEETSLLRGHFALDVARHFVPRALASPLKRVRRAWFARERPRPWLTDSFRERALRFADQAVWLGEGFHSAHARTVYLEARSKYHVHCMEWQNKVAAAHGMDAAFPFLDRDLISFLISVPGEIQNKDGVPRALLRAAMRGVLPEPIRARTWKADFTEITNRGMEVEYRGIADRLTGDSMSAQLGYLDASALRASLPVLANALRLPDHIAATDLRDLFGLDVWLEVFFGSHRSLTHPASSPVKESGL